MINDDKTIYNPSPDFVITSKRNLFVIHLMFFWYNDFTYFNEILLSKVIQNNIYFTIKRVWAVSSVFLWLLLCKFDISPTYTVWNLWKHWHFSTLGMFGSRNNYKLLPIFKMLIINPLSYVVYYFFWRMVKSVYVEI